MKPEHVFEADECRKAVYHYERELEHGVNGDFLFCKWGLFRHDDGIYFRPLENCRGAGFRIGTDNLDRCIEKIKKLNS